MQVDSNKRLKIIGVDHLSLINGFVVCGFLVVFSIGKNKNYHLFRKYKVLQSEPYGCNFENNILTSRLIDLIVVKQMNHYEEDDE